MSEAIERDDLNGEDIPLVQDELTVLKARADLLGISYHPSIGLDKLKAKIQEHLAEDEPKQDDDKPVAAVVEETEGEKRGRLRREALRLRRVVITCMNPAKKEWENEVFTAGNRAIGTIKRLVPFGADEGWHVEQIILNQILQRECQVFTSGKDSRGNTVRKGKMIREFNVTYLPDLSTDELHDLAQRQAMAGSIQN